MAKANPWWWTDYEYNRKVVKQVEAQITYWGAGKGKFKIDSSTVGMICTAHNMGEYYYFTTGMLQTPETIRWANYTPIMNNSLHHLIMQEVEFLLNNMNDYGAVNTMPLKDITDDSIIGRLKRYLLSDE